MQNFIGFGLIISQPLLSFVFYRLTELVLSQFVPSQQCIFVIFLQKTLQLKEIMYCQPAYYFMFF